MAYKKYWHRKSRFEYNQLPSKERDLLKKLKAFTTGRRWTHWPNILPWDNGKPVFYHSNVFRPNGKPKLINHTKPNRSYAKSIVYDRTIN